MIYNLYIYDRRVRVCTILPFLPFPTLDRHPPSLFPSLHLHQGACLFYREWSRPLNTLAEDPEEEKKLMFGMLYSIKGLVAALGSKVSSEEVRMEE